MTPSIHVDDRLVRVVVAPTETALVEEDLAAVARLTPEELARAIDKYTRRGPRMLDVDGVRVRVIGLRLFFDLADRRELPAELRALGDAARRTRRQAADYGVRVWAQRAYASAD